MNKLYLIKSALFGVAVADALGVPYEFLDRSDMLENPAKGMIGNGTYNQPAGTFSDDTSLTFCLAEALTHDFLLENVAKNFLKWYNEEFWTAGGVVFDIGITTEIALERLENGSSPERSGETDEFSNGNGSLMRILPLVFILKDLDFIQRFELTKQVSAITHGHIRSVIACFYYLEFASQLIEGNDKHSIYKNLQTSFPIQLKSIGIEEQEINVFKGLLIDSIANRSLNDVLSSGYVVHTLEASILCLLTTDNYSDAVLKSINLGGDTDTTAAVTGGLAALLYGFESIPNDWLAKLARKEDIEDLAIRMSEALS
jgi:ADP-ribosyl-[dinitrogen reductase] hydrolase